MGPLAVEPRAPRAGAAPPTSPPMEADPFLLFAVKRWNYGIPEAARVDIFTVENPDGTTYEGLPAPLVRAYEHIFPNFLAAGRLFARKRYDPFDEEQRWYRRLKEATGQAVMVNNPVRAESEFLDRTAATLRGVRPPDEGAVVNPPKR